MKTITLTPLLLGFSLLSVLCSSCKKSEDPLDLNRKDIAFEPAQHDQGDPGKIKQDANVLSIVTFRSRYGQSGSLSAEASMQYNGQGILTINTQSVSPLSTDRHTSLIGPTLAFINNEVNISTPDVWLVPVDPGLPPINMDIQKVEYNCDCEVDEFMEPGTCDVSTTWRGGGTLQVDCVEGLFPCYGKCILSSKTVSSTLPGGHILVQASSLIVNGVMYN